MADSDSLIVGVGASAGGLEAFKAFFQAVPADPGMAFVLVQHLDPEHRSALVNIVGDCTAMTVRSAEDGVAVEPNHVYVMPPDSVLRLESGVLRLTRPATTLARRVSINTFLTSLAEDQGENAVGIILSGFGSDGSLGVEAIKEHGGLTISQAEFDHAPKLGMPQSATATGWVDHVLPVEKMWDCLLHHRQFRSQTCGAKGPDGVRKDVEDNLGAISAILNSRLGRDISQYKTNTVMRRVQRRMQVLRTDTVLDYIEALRERSDEPDLLFREVLIRVTRFFRDPAAFETLSEKCIAPILAQGGPDDVIRVWVPGCATGEEAYSLAILFREAMALADQPRKIQIFATDIDDQAIGMARAGVFPDTIAVDVSAERLERYFQQEESQYRVSKDLREMCLFSVHDLVKDPPFSKLDLISCRNLMIYFAAPLQKRVVQMFHYALKPDGAVMLGASEALSTHARLFTPIDKKHRISRRLEAQASPAARHAIKPPEVGLTRKARVTPPPLEIKPEISRALGQFTPAYVIIDQHQDVQQFSGSIAKYLQPASGPASLNLSKLVHASLRLPLRAALKKARATQARVVDSGVDFQNEDRVETVNLVVEPLLEHDGGEGHMLVAFQDSPNRRPLAPVSSTGVTAEELTVSHEQLQTITEELETANEELQSSNEEYQSVNEELQSANEELETSKEELQSINEELQAVNAELADRNASLTDINSDLANLIDSTSIATLFLDGDLRIKRFTPALLSLFNVRAGDEGRPITDIVSHLARDGLQNDARRVMQTLMPVEREVGVLAGDRSYQMQVRPYRDLNNVINGVVITFVDISDRKRAEKDRADLAAIIDSSEDAVIGHDLQGLIQTWNRSAETIYGYTPAEAIGQPMTMLLSEGQADQWPAQLKQILSGIPIKQSDRVIVAKAGRIIDVSLTVSPVKDSTGKIVGGSAIARDITQQKLAEKQSALLLGELDHRVKNILAVVSSVVTQTIKTAQSPDELASSIEGRIQSIARAHSLLTHDGRMGATLAAIITVELEPYQRPIVPFTIAGDDVTLTPRAGMVLSMAIHELTTNAVKYGALGAEHGRLDIRWWRHEAEEAPVLRISWIERGGPPVSTPTRRGFGTTLIERALSHEFDAKVTREFRPSGLVCSIDIPLTEEVGHIGVRGREETS